jgi:hypothetical protein
MMGVISWARERFRPIPDIGADERWGEELLAVGDGSLLADDDSMSWMNTAAGPREVKLLAAEVRAESTLTRARGVVSKTQFDADVSAMMLHADLLLMEQRGLERINKVYFDVMAKLGFDVPTAWDFLETARNTVLLKDLDLQLV